LPVVETWRSHRVGIFSANSGRRKTLFGTIKQVWGYGALLLHRMKNVVSEVALMTITYNIRRVLNITGTKNLILQLQHL